MPTARPPIIDDTHDPTLVSWFEPANDPVTDFPIQNLPLGVFVPRGRDPVPRLGVAIGDRVLDLRAASSARLLDGVGDAMAEALGAWTLNPSMARPWDERRALRRALSALFRVTNAKRGPSVSPYLLPLDEVDLLVPAAVGDYTDFYASIFHATNVGSMFRPDNPLLPNYKFVPIGYHGRASSIVPSGAAIRRPCGQTRAEEAAMPAFGPSARLDYELEVGLFVGPGNTLGTRSRLTGPRTT